MKQQSSESAIVRSGIHGGYRARNQFTTAARKLTFAAVVAFSTMSLAACAGRVAPNDAVIVASHGPPHRQTEFRPLRPGSRFVFVPGRWAWQGSAYTWRAGEWVLPPAGYRSWRAGEWRHDRRGWYWYEGRWR